MIPPSAPKQHASDAEITAAAAWVADAFPVKGYLSDWTLGYLFPWVARLVKRHLPPGAKVLDFGSGPGDIAAFLARIGYSCTACDDLQDPWHLKDDNRRKILEFNERAGVEFKVLAHDQPFPWTTPTFDLMLAHHVLEHIHDSPRPLLNLLISCVKDNGLLLIAVPNAANLRKRLAVLRGRTNYPPFVHVYWYEGVWRGHVREYVRSDLEEMVRFAGLELVELGTYHYLAGSISSKLRVFWKLATALIPSGRDSWYVLARKPAGWKPRTAIDPNDPTAARLAAIWH